MKTQDLLDGFYIWTSTEEHQVLHKITQPSLLESFSERDQTIIQQLIRKSLLIKVETKNNIYVYPNI